MEETATLCSARMCLGCVLLCRNSHKKVTEVSPIFYRITEDRQVQTKDPKTLLHCSLSMKVRKMY